LNSPLTQDKKTFFIDGLVRPYDLDEHLTVIDLVPELFAKETSRRGRNGSAGADFKDAVDRGLAKSE
jgi:hypothetical protein